MALRSFTSRIVPVMAFVAVLGGTVTALGSAPATAAATGSGPVDVLYAGSLVTVMQQDLGPAFEKATGYTVNGVSAGSTDLAAEIKAGTQQADVFISAAPAVNATLTGQANGDWVSWYASFGTSPLLLAYNPNSSFAQQLKTKPWYEVVGQSGFLLGRTDPATDPKGVLAVTALTEAAKKYKQPALAAIANSTTGEYPEQTLVGELQAGQLDAGFFYGVEASAAHLKTIPLRGIATLSATYTVTVVNRAPHLAAARSFTAFLLGKKGRAILAANGIASISPPKVTGKIPATVKGAVPG